MLQVRGAPSKVMLQVRDTPCEIFSGWGDALGEELSTLLALEEGQCSRSSENKWQVGGLAVLESQGFVGCRTEPWEGGDHICTIK